jgi:hypothetical protein
VSTHERIRALKNEAAELEQQAADEDRDNAYIAALREERVSWERRRDIALSFGDQRERLQTPAGTIEAEKTGYERALEAEDAIAGIDAEILRVQGA